MEPDMDVSPLKIGETRTSSIKVIMLNGEFVSMEETILEADEVVSEEEDKEVVDDLEEEDDDEEEEDKDDDEEEEVSTW